MTPTARSLAELRKRGVVAQVVEQTIPKMFIKRDVFGVIDIIAMGGGHIVGIQATSGSNHAARVAKILEEPRARQWIENGGRLQVWSWSKRGERGKRKLWTLRIEEIHEADFRQEAVA